MSSSPLDILLSNYPALGVCADAITECVRLIGDAFAADGTLFTCGNGGSCADADHIAGEFLKGFCKRRPVTEETTQALLRAGGSDEGQFLAAKLQRGLRCIPLSTSFPGALTAVRNDLDGQLDYAQALFALARPGDLLLGISTSGNSRNVRYAAEVAKACGMKVLALTGEGGGKLAEIADVAVRVPAHETYRIQELHLPVYHAICRCVEERFFDK